MDYYYRSTIQVFEIARGSVPYQDLRPTLNLNVTVLLVSSESVKVRSSIVRICPTFVLDVDSLRL